MMSNRRPLVAVVFDMDGTLLDSLPAQLESYRLAILGAGGRDHSHEEVLRAFPLGSAAVMMQALIGRDVGTEAVDRYEVHLRAAASSVSAYAGITEALADLSPRFRLGVFTAADTIAAEILLESTRLRSFFDVVIGADRLARTKPAPDGLIKVCDGLGVDPRVAAYVGDASVDVEVARACGALAVAAGWGDRYSNDRTADIVVDTPGDLLGCLVEAGGVSSRRRP